MIDRILVGTDGSDLADRATETALRLAEVCEARLRFLHAVEELSMLGPDPGMEPRLAQARGDAGEQILEENLRWAREREVPADTVLRDGSAAALLMQEAEEWGADFLAVGSRGRSGLERAVLGSVADALVRRSALPVLTVRETTPRQEGPIERVLVPSDGSELALSAFPLAVELARRAGAQMQMLYAREEGEDEGQASRALDPLAERCQQAGVACRRFLVQASPHRAIVDHVEEHGNDLVVMATHGRGGLERFLVGSITDKVVRTVPAPLVTVRPEHRED